MRRDTPRVMTGGAPVNWLGANFWSRTGGPLMWRSYDPAVIAAELAVLKRHGLTMTRSFFYWPDFMPGPREIDETMTARFADFLDRHAEQGLTTIPTFIVGHMSGENWDPAWRDGRDLYGDVWMVGRQAWFAAEMVRRFRAHPAVAGWLVSNEMPLYGGEDTGHEIVSAWARIIRDAVRAAGGHQPFSLGDGAWGIEVSGRDNGFRLADIAELTDFLGPHVYPVGDDPVRQRYAAAVACELAGTFGKPVIMEEFGVSSDFASDANAATYYRHVLHSTLLAGATGWIAWNNTDFALPQQDPYRHHAFEQNFGLTDAHGTPEGHAHRAARPSRRRSTAIDYAELRARRHRHRADRLQLPGHPVPVHLAGQPHRRRPGAAPVLHRRPARRPAAQADQGDRRHRTRRAALPRPVRQAVPRPHRRRAGAPRGRRRHGLRLLLRRRRLLAPRPVLRGDERAVRHQAPARRRPRRPDHRRGRRAHLHQGLRRPQPGHHAHLPGRRERARRAYLPLAPTTAEVIATDAHGRPALLRRQAGRGSLILCTYPLEYMAPPSPGSTRTRRSRSTARSPPTRGSAGRSPSKTRTSPATSSCTATGPGYVVIASHADEPLTIKPALSACGEHEPPRG